MKLNRGTWWYLIVVCIMYKNSEWYLKPSTDHFTVLSLPYKIHSKYQHFNIKTVRNNLNVFVYINFVLVTFWLLFGLLKWHQSVSQQFISEAAINIRKWLFRYIVIRDTLLSSTSTTVPLVFSPLLPKLHPSLCSVRWKAPFLLEWLK